MHELYGPCPLGATSPSRISLQTPPSPRRLFLKRNSLDIRESLRPPGRSVQDNDASFEQQAAIVTIMATVVAQALLAPTEKAARECACHTICTCALRSNVAAMRLKHKTAMIRAAWKRSFPNNLGNNILTTSRHVRAGRQYVCLDPLWPTPSRERMLSGSLGRYRPIEPHTLQRNGSAALYFMGGKGSQFRQYIQEMSQPWLRPCKVVASVGQCGNLQGNVAISGMLWQCVNA